MGRGVSSTIVAELADNKWISHGDGEEAIRAEKISELEDNLQGRQGDVYDRLIQSWETNTKMSTIDIANALNLTANKALRTLKALERYQEFLDDYPNSNFNDDVISSIESLREKLGIQNYQFSLLLLNFLYSWQPQAFSDNQLGRRGRDSNPRQKLPPVTP